MDIKMRLVRAIGIAMLLGGWGLTQYVAEQNRSIAAVVPGYSGGEWGRAADAFGIREWFTGDIAAWPARYIFATGVLLMAVGGGMVTFTVDWPRREAVTRGSSP